MKLYTTYESKNAAAYLRMSTDKQNFSIDHQRAHIHEFARSHGLSIVAEYTDEGKSGLDLKGRPGLQALLAAVQRDLVAFSSILVYDVSRWGRFQDVDESAHYEYVCRSAGVEVIYCAENFHNDGSPMEALLKSIKRTMAAEYSRELSAKVFKAQCRFVGLGFKQGGSAGYALRRQVVSASGAVKGLLSSGQRKGNASDRVIFVTGPQHEIDTLSRIYFMYIDDLLGETEIARRLNQEGIPSEFDRPWSPWMVKSVLTNEKYLGDMVFNRGSFKLHRNSVHNPRDEWIRNTGAFESPLPVGLFARAQAERVRRNARPEKTQLLEQLRDLYKAHGKVTTAILYRVKSTLPKLLARHFGTITNAYFLAGITPSSSFKYVSTRRFVAATRRNVLAQCVALCPDARAEPKPGNSTLFIVDRKFDVAIVVARNRGVKAGNARWKLQPPKSSNVSFVIAVQLKPSNEEIEAYFVLPQGAFTNGDITLREERPATLKGYRFGSIADIFGLQNGADNGDQ